MLTPNDADTVNARPRVPVPAMKLLIQMWMMWPPRERSSLHFTSEEGGSLLEGGERTEHTSLSILPQA